jgi:hypothetical protein
MTASADGSWLLTGVAQCVPWGGVSDGPPDSRHESAPQLVPDPVSCALSLVGGGVLLVRRAD